MAEPRFDKDALAAFCRNHRIKRLSLFGSVLTPDFGPESDIDVLVEFEPGATPGFFGIFGMERELSEIFHGRKIDLKTKEDISRHFRDEVIRNAEVQYASG